MLKITIDHVYEKREERIWEIPIEGEDDNAHHECYAKEAKALIISKVEEFKGDKEKLRWWLEENYGDATWWDGWDNSDEFEVKVEDTQSELEFNLLQKMPDDIIATYKKDLEAGLDCYNYFLVEKRDVGYHRRGQPVSLSSLQVAIGHARATVEQFFVIVRDSDNSTLHNLKTKGGISEEALSYFFKCINADNDGAAELFNSSRIPCEPA